MIVVLAVASPAAAVSEYKGKYRPLVVFAPSADDQSLRRQRQTVASFRPAFIDRKMVVVYVTGDSVTADLGPAPSLSAAGLRKRFGISPRHFRAILIDLNGGAKLSEPSPIAAQTLFRTIDAMPMRQDETRK